MTRPPLLLPMVGEAQVEVTGQSEGRDSMILRHELQNLQAASRPLSLGPEKPCAIPHLSHRLSADDIACSHSRGGFSLQSQVQRVLRWMTTFRQMFLSCFAR
jgi:hypothetical protein